MSQRRAGGDPVQNAKLLEEQLVQMLAAGSSQAKALDRQEKLIDENLQRIAGIDTQDALDFRNRLEADQITLGIEIEDAHFRFASIQEFLAYNF